MLFEVNFLAVAAAAAATMLLGALWYGALFGKLWMSAHGYTPERLEEMRKGMGKAYGLSFLCYLVMATVLAILIGWVGAGNVWTGLCMAFYCWLGFVATIGLTSHLFSDRKLATYLIDVGYQLVYMLAMGAILGAWR
jgi:hypothetical protein